MRKIGFIIGLLGSLLACNPSEPQRGNNWQDTIAGDTGSPATVAQTAIDTPWELTVADPFILTYKGKIGADSAQLELIHWGGGQLDGLLRRNGDPKMIELFGGIDLSEEAKLEAFRGQQTIATMRASLSRLDSVEGFWHPEEGKKEPFSFRWYFPGRDPVSWFGDWYLNGIYENAQLVIGNVSDTEFDLALSVLRNGSTGEMLATASWDGHRAVVHDTLFDGFGPCILELVRKQNGIVVTQESQSLDCGFGARAYADGFYVPEAQNMRPELSYGSADKVFPSVEVHDAFRLHVGEKLYELFAFNMQVVQQAQVQWPGHIGQLNTGAARGLINLHEAAILHDNQQYFWALTLDYDEEAEENLLLYFSNHPEYQTRLPGPLEEWAKSFPDYKMVFQPAG